MIFSLPRDDRVSVAAAQDRTRRRLHVSGIAFVVRCAEEMLKNLSGEFRKSRVMRKCFVCGS